MSGMLYLSEHDVVRLLTLATAIDALEPMLREQARGQAHNVPKTYATWDDGCAMHALGSRMQGYVGFKTWAITPRGGGSIFSLFDARQGALLALIEARALGQLRTAAISGVATRVLSRPQARSFALIGTGAQAMLQLAAVAAVRPLDRVRVHSPTPEKRAAFVAAARRRFGFAIEAMESVAAAVDGADVVTLVTRARNPFLDAAMLGPDVHLNAVGAILPTHAEFNQDVLARARCVVVDDLENARRGSRELIEGCGASPGGWGRVGTLGELLAEPAAAAPAGGLSIFKGMGMGLSDLALATLVYERARASGEGRALPAQERVHPLDAPR